MALTQTLGQLLEQHRSAQDYKPAGIPADRKVTTIKNLREATSLGLKEAKDFVEALMHVTPENIGDMARIIAVICADMRFQIPPQERELIRALWVARIHDYQAIIPLCEKAYGTSIDNNSARWAYLDWLANTNPR